MNPNQLYLIWIRYHFGRMESAWLHRNAQMPIETGFCEMQIGG